MPRGEQPGRTGADNKFAKYAAEQQKALLEILAEEQKVAGKESEIEWRATKLLADLELEVRPSTIDRARLYFELRTAIRHTAMRTGTMETSGTAKNSALMSSLGAITKQANDVYAKLVIEAELAKKVRAAAPPIPVEAVIGARPRAFPIDDVPHPAAADADDGWGKPLSES